ncbi:MAG: ATP-binding protein [Candidatus Omnitrophica bacterium]|nr:ATP-binding protein [Candidatus Omnitrophota bacterium]MBU1048205.1 ATP-binding protein [Candidatus Omnitrophota bacterium]MBU1767401.1 ATP-binding protein [Candidatus Omnitrophota bacterium]MBU1888701.1 ATP-binding protein [Candidatus Omnitrophota bacterium]
MYIKRELEDKIKSYLNKPEILAVIGPRQSGKTTLLKQIAKPLKKAKYIDFEDRDTLNLFNDDIKTFYNLHVKGAEYLFIDEFQYAKEGGQKLKYLYDTHKTKIIISGSSVLDLTNQALKYLVGRIFTFQLYPFSFKEFLSFRNPALYENLYLEVKEKIDNYFADKRKTPPLVSDAVIQEISKYYYEYVIYGGYPRVAIADGKEEKITVLKNIYNIYLLREIRDILQLSTELELQKLIKALALQTGSLVVYNELSQITSLNYKKLLEHINILEKTFLIKKVMPFYRNKRVEIAKSPKVYFCDNGFRNVAIDNFQELVQRTDRGKLNENFVASQLLKEEDNINYWRTKSNAEIDFILERRGQITAVEVKSTLHSNKTGRALLSFKEKYSPNKMVVLSENYFAFDKKRNVLFMPLFFI